MPWGDDGFKQSPGNKQDIPDIDEVIKKIKEFLGGNGLSGIVIVVLVIAVITALTCFYSIQPGEVGIVQRFGRFLRIATPGLNFKLPAGIENVTKVKQQYVFTEEFGIRTISAGVRTQYAPSRRYVNESLMLTGDLNCALLPWIVQYRIGDPYKYLFEIRNVQKTLRDTSEAIMRQIAGDRSINEIISNRIEIATASKRELQKALNEAETGITIVNVELKKTTVPEPVQPSFNEVNQAMQEKETMIYEAREAYNKVIPEAKGEADRLIKDAEGYALERINMAKGDASRFLQQWQAYRSAKDVTRRRLYLETMETVIPNMGIKYILDPKQSRLLPLLNLNEKQGDKK